MAESTNKFLCVIEACKIACKLAQQILKIMRKKYLNLKVIKFSKFYNAFY
jgi:hypothetical protein